MKSIKDKFLSYSVDKDGVALIEINQKEEPAKFKSLKPLIDQLWQEGRVVTDA